MAVLLSSGSISKEEAVGPAAHMHLIVQLSKNLEGTQWLSYDRDFHQWAVLESGVNSTCPFMADVSLFRNQLQTRAPASSEKARGLGVPVLNGMTMAFVIKLVIIDMSAPPVVGTSVFIHSQVSQAAVISSPYCTLKHLRMLCSSDYSIYCVLVPCMFKLVIQFITC